MDIPLRSINRIAIAGSGPGGLTLANLLLHRGFEVTVYEQAPRFERIGAGIQLGANATAVLTHIEGLIGRLSVLGTTPTAFRSYAHDTGQLLSETSVAGRAYRTPYLQLHRADLHDALVGALPRNVITMGRRLVGLDQDHEGVTLRFHDGTVERADLLVGADGIHSVVRDQLFGERPLSFAGWASHRGILPVEDLADLEIDVEGAKWMAPDRHLIHYYVSDKELTFIAVLPEIAASLESWSRESDKDAILDALEDFHRIPREMVKRCKLVNKWAIYDRDALMTWSVGRVTLMGDAAHPVRPFMAQGGGMAIEDAAVLTRSLTELPEGATVLDALSVYEHNRRPRTALVQASSRTHDFFRPEFNRPDSPSGARWLYSYDAWTAPLEIPEYLEMAGRTGA